MRLNTVNKYEALAQYLGIDVDAIEESNYDNCLFEINPRKAKRGDGVGKLAAQVAYLREALAAIGMESAQSFALSAYGSYSEIEKRLRENPITAPMLKTGIHTVLNTLYHLMKDEDGSWHQRTLHGLFNGVPKEDIVDEREEYDDNSGEYLVLTDSERDKRAMEALDDYAQEFILSSVPENLRSYFDTDKWKQDALDSDGYGHTLSSYDGDENEIQIEGKTVYIYRVN